MNIEEVIKACEFIGEHWTGDDGDKVAEAARLIRACRAAECRWAGKERS